jgi:nitrous oxidase accessory protein NosD
MRKAFARSALIGVAGGAAALSGLALPWLAPGTASAAPSTVYVSPSGSASAADQSCGTAGYQSVQAAVDAVSSGGTVIVCAGTYDESVTVGQSLRLQGRPGATIDAAGQPYGVGVAASYVTVAGLTVENASVGATLADGIVTAGLVNGTMVPADHVTIIGNVTEDNDGSGIDLNSTSYSTATGNRSTGNAVGINVSDDFNQSAAHNRISANVTNDNPGGCGIALADHTGKGIYDNVVIGNVSNDNGLGTPTGTSASAGSGVILAAPAAGGVYDNIVAGNTFDGNGHAGFDVHAHAPGLNFSGNLVIGNRIGVNNLRTSEGDPDTTGVYLGDASPLTITVVGNIISNDHFGIFSAGGPVTVHGAAHNVFRNVPVHSASTSTFD